MPKQIKTTTGAINPVKVMPKRIKTTLLHTPPTMCCNGLPIQARPNHPHEGGRGTSPVQSSLDTTQSSPAAPQAPGVASPHVPQCHRTASPGCQRSWGSSHAVGSTQQCVTTNNHHNRIRASCAVNMFLYIDIIIKLYIYIYIYYDFAVLELDVSTVVRR